LPVKRVSHVFEAQEEVIYGEFISKQVLLLLELQDLMKTEVLKAQSFQEDAFYILEEEARIVLEVLADEI
jgi:hypothetical protein